MATLSTLGRYQIERVLGKGAMGVVYEALDPKLHRKVAIKTILVSQLDPETAKDFSMRFVREAHAVARLNHPNIVQVYDFGEEGEVAYLVMEFIRGNELKSALATSAAFDRNESVRIMCELLDALDFAHEQGVIHRDIKPANVMLDTQGRVKLTDFGVARLTDTDRTSAERTQAGTMVGTPAYMSPEQIQGHRVDRRSDIFSAGIILYQLLTGQKPFTGEGAWTVAKKIIQDEPPTPSSLNVAVSPQLDRVAAKALAKRPEDRYATAREFAGALRSAAEGKAADQMFEPTVIVPRVPEPPGALRSGEMDLEFWRSIKDSNDLNDLELYLKQFPKGVYASLAERRIARLRGLPVEAGAEASYTRPLDRTDRTRGERPVGRIEPKLAEAPASQRTFKLTGTRGGEREREITGKSEAAEKSRPKRVPVIIGLLAVAAVAAYFALKPDLRIPGISSSVVDVTEQATREAAQRRGAEAAAREAELKARQEAEAGAKREAQLRAKREAELQSQREAEAKAKAQREADLKAQREQAQREANLRAKAEAELRAQREAEARNRRAAAEAAQREADLRAKREAEAVAKRNAEARAQREAEVKAKLAAEASSWNSIKASNSPANFQRYLEQYPNGRYAELARKRLAALEKARLDEEKRIAAEKARIDSERQAEAQRAKAREAELAKQAAKPKRPVIVPPSF